MHFSGLVIIPFTETRKGAEDTVANILAPHCENLDEKIQQECYCAAPKTDRAAIKRVLKEEFGWEKFKDMEAAFDSTAYPDFESQTQAWQKFASPFLARQSALQREFVLPGKPDPDCEDCAGTGIATSSYNPDGKWDWWVIGGRWTGVISGYDPREDEANKETCFICHGSGQRGDKVGRELRKADPTFKCNSCDGSGKSVKWTLNDHDGDILPVVALLGLDVLSNRIHSFVEPDGTWHESVLSWAEERVNTEGVEEWKEEIAETLSKYMSLEFLAVVVDYHT